MPGSEELIRLNRYCDCNPGNGLVANWVDSRLLVEAFNRDFFFFGLEALHRVLGLISRESRLTNIKIDREIGAV